MGAMANLFAVTLLGINILFNALRATSPSAGRHHYFVVDFQLVLEMALHGTVMTTVTMADAPHVILMALLRMEYLDCDCDQYERNYGKLESNVKVCVIVPERQNNEWKVD